MLMMDENGLKEHGGDLGGVHMEKSLLFPLHNSRSSMEAITNSR